MLEIAKNALKDLYHAGGIEKLDSTVSFDSNITTDKKILRMPRSLHSPLGLGLGKTLQLRKSCTYWECSRLCIADASIAALMARRVRRQKLALGNGIKAKVS
jgi:hypothetical protein